MKQKRKNNDAPASKNKTLITLAVSVAVIFGAGLPFFFMLTVDAPDIETVVTTMEAATFFSSADEDLQPLSAPSPITSPDGKWLASVDFEGERQRIILYDTSAEEQDRVPFYAEGSPITTFAFHPSSEWLAVGTQRDVQLINIYASEQRYYPIEENERVRGIAFSPNGGLLAIATQENTLVGSITIIPIVDGAQSALSFGEPPVRFTVPSLTNLTFIDDSLIGALGDDGLFYRWNTEGEPR